MWSAIGLDAGDWLDACAAEDLNSLVHQRLSRLSDGGWPAEVRTAAARHAYAEAARELLRRDEVMSALDALAAAGVHPILFKGTPLAYSVYEIPSARPRGDTDLLIPYDEAEAARRAMGALGFSSPVYCDGELLFCQFEVQRTDRYGVIHAFDFHWKISTQSVFADLLTHDELSSEACAVPALGPRARAAGPVHALLLACVHPVMHHRNERRLLWVYDIHLLVSQLSAVELHRFVELSITKKVTAIVAHELLLARSLFGTSIPDDAIARLRESQVQEPSATYLVPDRRWHDELASNLRAFSRWRDRLRLLREVMLPNGAYVRRRYAVSPGWTGAATLPIFYLHRLVHGAWNVLTGRK